MNHEAHSRLHESLIVQVGENYMINDIDQVAPSLLAVVVQVTDLRQNLENDNAKLDESLLRDPPSPVIFSHFVENSHNFLDAALFAETIDSDAKNVPADNILHYTNYSHCLSTYMILFAWLLNPGVPGEREHEFI